jgi:hypothetical protein
MNLLQHQHMNLLQHPHMNLLQHPHIRLYSIESISISTGITTRSSPKSNFEYFLVFSYCTPNWIFSVCSVSISISCRFKLITYSYVYIMCQHSVIRLLRSR